MSQQFYIRIRGIEQGPFDEGQLMQLVRRGQLARIHEISTDRKHWSVAEEYPQFFISVVPARSLDPEQVARIDNERMTLQPADGEFAGDLESGGSDYDPSAGEDPSFDSGEGDYAALAAGGPGDELEDLSERRPRRRQASSGVFSFNTLLQLIFALIIVCALGVLAFTFLR